MFIYSYLLLLILILGEVYFHLINFWVNLLYGCKFWHFLCGHICQLLACFIHYVISKERGFSIQSKNKLFTNPFSWDLWFLEIFRGHQSSGQHRVNQVKLIYFNDCSLWYESCYVILNLAKYLASKQFSLEFKCFFVIFIESSHDTCDLCV